MKIFECKCGSTEVFIEQSGNNIGLYCADCGKWITWLNKDQLRLAKRQIDNHDKKIREDERIKTINEFVERYNRCNNDICYKKEQNINCCECIAEQLKGDE